MFKKIKYIITCVILMIVIILLMFMIFLVKNDDLEAFFDVHVINGYYDKELSNLDMGIDSIVYNQYYYSSNYDKKFMKCKDYKLVTKDNIKYVNSYFTNYKDRVDFEFDVPNISEGDYYYLRNEEEQRVKEFYTYAIYLYDINSHKLIYIQY